MAVAPNKRSIMTLYSKADEVHSHRVRIVLAEKGVTVDILDIDLLPKAKEELNQLNPYGFAPTLVDRELVLYTSEIIMEYLDERFPHPPLMPVYPVAKGRTRLMMYRINRDWYSDLDKIHNALGSASQINAAKKHLKESITSIAPVFNEMPYFFGEEFSMLDCCLAPLLWRLPSLGIELPREAKAVLDYAERMFNREAFIASLTNIETNMRS